MDFTHLHVHSDYSLLDGLNRIEDLLKKSQEYKMSAIALTDHGVMYGAGEFWKMSHDFGVKPIIGCEIYLAPQQMGLRQEVDGIKYYHLLLLAKNLIGYKNLAKIVSASHLEGFYYRPRADVETLKKYSEGLICTSACLAGPIARHLLKNQEEQAIEWLQTLKSIYKENFYLELQRNGFKNSDNDKSGIIGTYDTETLELIDQQMFVNRKLREYSERFKIDLVATTDAHYLNKDDRDVQTILFCIKDGLKITDPNKRNGYTETYIKSPEEMYAHFEDDPTPLINTMKIAEQIEDFSIKFKRVQPRYLDLPEGSNAKDELRRQTLEGAVKRFGSISESLQARLELELDVIDQKGYNDYFLVVGDLIKYARSQGIVVGVRGSAAGCMVAYCLDITNIDPIKWELYFERFLNLERPSPPDIDMDFQDDRRDEVIKYAIQKYGEKNVAAICAVGRLKTKAAIRDVARVMGVDLRIADTLSKKVQVVFGKVFTVDKMMEVDKEFAEIINSSPELQKLAATVRKIEGLARHMSRHAAGYLITPDPIDEFMALQKDSKDAEMMMTQLDGTWIDKLDFMKFDLLGLRTLTIIKNAIDLIQERHGVKIDVTQIPEDDKEAFKLFGRGETIGVFQFESPPMQQYLKELVPETLEDICFLAAAYRPGPMKFIPDYIKCKHGQMQPSYLIPELEPILNKTYGFPIYQEQLFAICRDLGGFTLGEGDVIRNALKKKQLDILQEKEPGFLKYFTTNYPYDAETGKQIWANLTPFSDYGFNKAHAASYAVVAYWCAYIKAHYPLEFIAALMHSDLESQDRIIIDIREAKRMNYKVLGPNINNSGVYFTTLGDDTVIFGLGAIKGVGIKISEEIIEERKKNGNYQNVDDFVKRITPGKLNKRTMEALVKAGCFDAFGERNAILTTIPAIFQNASDFLHAQNIGQFSLFGDGGATTDGQDSHQVTELIKTQPATERELQGWEKELMGVYISSHPLEQYSHLMVSSALTDFHRAEWLRDGEKFKVLAMISSKKITHTKTKGEAMAILQIEDLDKRLDGVVFPKSYAAFANSLVEGEPAIFECLANHKREDFSVIVEGITKIEDFQNISNEILIDICKLHDVEKLNELKEVISKNPGELSLRIKYGQPIEGKELVRKINPTAAVMQVINKYRR